MFVNERQQVYIYIYIYVPNPFGVSNKLDVINDEVSAHGEETETCVEGYLLTINLTFLVIY